MIVPEILVCSSFLISVCMFIVSKALLISSDTVIGREGGVIWLNHLATVLFTVCSAVIVECCVLYPCCRGVFGMLRAVFNMFLRNARRGLMCFRCLMFNLSGPCELLFILCFIASWT